MRKKNTELLSDVIYQVLKEQHLDKPLFEKRLIEAWPLVLGSNIVKYTSELKIMNKVLYVSLTSSVLRHDLFLSREEIKKSLNKQVGAEVIVDIVFKWSPLAPKGERNRQFYDRINKLWPLTEQAGTKEIERKLHKKRRLTQIKTDFRTLI